MPKVEQVKTILNFKSNNENVRDVFLHKNNICDVNKMIWLVYWTNVPLSQ